MRCVGSTKEAGSVGLSPIGVVENLEDYFITKNIPIDDIPKENWCTFHRLPSKIKTKKTIPTKSYVQTTDQSDMGHMISAHMKTWGDYTSSVIYHGENDEGCQSFSVRGSERVCPHCKITHDGNGAYVTSLGSGNFRYKCLSPSNPSFKSYYFSTDRTDKPSITGNPFKRKRESVDQTPNDVSSNALEDLRKGFYRVSWAFKRSVSW